ncbi:MAG: hypothetical protein ABW005_15990 [Burkholderiaceae bacterium]
MKMPGLALPPPAAVPLLGAGEALGVWRVVEPLHASDAGQWYSARHALAADRGAALLVLQRSERAADAMLRFADQAGDLGRLDHAAIRVPSDSGVTAGGQPYLILDWADGDPLLRACAALPLRVRLQLLVQLCELLRYVHQQGWLLGEIDPAMLWLGPDQHLTLMGVGLQRMPDPADPFERGTAPGALPGYKSPELQAGAPPSLSSEAFGVGALLLMLVDGRLPADLGEDFDAAALAGAWPELGAAERLSLDALLHKAAAPLPARRHASAEALADDLRAWLLGQNHSALTLTPMPVPAPALALASGPARGRLGLDIDFDVLESEPAALAAAQADGGSGWRRMLSGLASLMPGGRAARG